MSVRLIQGDCLERMGEIEDGSVDFILTDPPFGVTQCRWDTVIPFEPLWDHYRRILKPRGAVVLMASQPFTSMLVMSNREWFRYSLVWDQKVTTGFLNAKVAPLRSHQDILVFYGRQPTFNPQKTPRSSEEVKRLQKKRKGFGGRLDEEVYGERLYYNGPNRLDNLTKCPTSIISITARETEGVRGLHPTQKPVALMEYLIRTYSDEGDTILDSCMGSGTTLVACLNTNRHGIGIESDPEYFRIAESRIAAELARHPLLPPAEATA